VWRFNFNLVLKLKNHTAEAGGVGFMSGEVVRRLKLKNHTAKAGGVGFTSGEVS